MAKGGQIPPIFFLFIPLKRNPVDICNSYRIVGNSVGTNFSEVEKKQACIIKFVGQIL